jgi:hypothetical protein
MTLIIGPDSSFMATGDKAEHMQHDLLRRWTFILGQVGRMPGEKAVFHVPGNFPRF